jgi:putative transposase
LYRSSPAQQPGLRLLRQAIAAELKSIYRAADAQAGEATLAAFETSKWGAKYPAIAQGWRRVWGEIVPFYAFSDDVRRIVYTPLRP